MFGKETLFNSQLTMLKRCYIGCYNQLCSFHNNSSDLTVCVSKNWTSVNTMF